MSLTTIGRFRRIAGTLAAVGMAGLIILAGRDTLAEPVKAGSISIEQPWSRATPGGAKVGAGYLIIKNGGATPDKLVSVSTEVAGRTEIHEMSMTDGVMKMRPLPDGLPVPANGTVALKPGSYHLMLLDLKRPLKEGETFAGTLTFETAGTVDVTFAVEGRGAKAPEGNEHQHH